MLTSSLTKPGHVDATLAALCALTMGMGLYAVFRVGPAVPNAGAAGAREIGRIELTDNYVRRRHDSSLVWREVSGDTSIFDGDMVYAAADSGAHIRLHDGTHVAVEPNSLVVLRSEVTRARPAAELVRGSISSRTTSPLDVVTRSGDYLLHSSTLARVHVGKAETRLNVAAGEARMRTGGQDTMLEAGQGAAVNDGAVHVRASSIDLGVPLDGTTVEAPAGAAPVQFTFAAATSGPYRLQVSRTIDFATLLFDIPVAGRNATLRLPVGVFFWRVASTRSRRGTSFERRLSVVNPRAPRLLSPLPDELVDLSTRPLVLAWTRGQRESSFVLEVRSPAGGGAMHETREPRWVAPRDLAEGRYCARVRERSAKVWSAEVCARVVHFPVLPAPKLLPSGGDGVEQSAPDEHGWLWWLIGGVAHAHATPPAATTTLRWAPVPGAVSYLLEISQDPTFVHIPWRETVTATSFLFAPPSAGTYYWRVAAVDERDRAGERSATASTVVLPIVRLEQPSHNADMVVHRSPHRVTVTWQAHPGATRFELQLARSRDMSTASRLIVTHPSYTWSFTEMGLYCWRVIVLDNSEIRGPPSDTRCFTLRIPPPHIQRATRQGDTVELAWSERAAATYLVALARGSDFVDALETQQQDARAAITWSDHGPVFARVRTLRPSSDWSTPVRVTQHEETSSQASARQSSPVVHLLPYAGVATNFSSMIGPKIGAELGLWPYPSWGRLLLAIDGSYALTAGLGGQRPREQGAVAHIFVGSLGAFGRVPTPWLDVLFGAGVEITSARVLIRDAGGSRNVSGLGGMLRVGGMHPFDWGLLISRASLSLTTQNATDLAGLGASLFLELGYALTLE